MSFQQEWNAISNRIKGLTESGMYFFSSVHQTKDQNETVIKHFLKPHAKRLVEDIKKYCDSFSLNLPDAALTCIKSFLKDFKDHFHEDISGIGPVQIALTSLSSFRSEFSYHLSDIQAISKRITERAFVHLQRSIVADSSVRDRWIEVYEDKETSCEKLGAVHLLLHGIWAFKASEVGERTDLILGEPITDIAEAEAVADALVLTEWKVVRKSNEIQSQSEQAFKQAKRYSSGVLAGFELANYRYLVLVSEKHIELPTDIQDEDIIYKHINIAVNPDTPSES